MFDGQRDALVLVYHPIKEKNRNLKDKFEAFAESLNVEGVENLLVGRYNGINESAVFKNPKKLPALIYFGSSEKDKEDKKVPPIKASSEY